VGGPPPAPARQADTPRAGLPARGRRARGPHAPPPGLSTPGEIPRRQKTLGFKSSYFLLPIVFPVSLESVLLCLHCLCVVGGGYQQAFSCSIIPEFYDRKKTLHPTNPHPILHGCRPTGRLPAADRSCHAKNLLEGVRIPRPTKLTSSVFLLWVWWGLSYGRLPAAPSARVRLQQGREHNALAALRLFGDDTEDDARERGGGIAHPVGLGPSFESHRRSMRWRGHPSDSKVGLCIFPTAHPEGF